MSQYLQIAKEIAGLVENKQIQYGDAHGKSGDILNILYPNGILKHQMGDALTIVRIIDKLFRIANNRFKDMESPWEDILGYCLLAINKEKKEYKYEHKVLMDLPEPTLQKDHR